MSYDDMEIEDHEFYLQNVVSFGQRQLTRLHQYHERGNGLQWPHLNEDTLIERADANMMNAYGLMVHDHQYLVDGDLEAHMSRVADQIADAANFLLIAVSAHYGAMQRDAEERDEEEARQESLREFEVDRMVNEGGRDE